MEQSLGRPWKSQEQEEGEHRFYPSADKVSMLVAVDLLIILEYTLAGAGAHEVVVALAGCQAAAHRGTRLVAALTSLGGEDGTAILNEISFEISF